MREGVQWPPWINCTLVVSQWKNWFFITHVCCSPLLSSVWVGSEASRSFVRTWSVAWGCGRNPVLACSSILASSVSVVWSLCSDFLQTRFIFCLCVVLAVGARARFRSRPVFISARVFLFSVPCASPGLRPVPDLLQLGADLTTYVRFSLVSPRSSFLLPVIWFPVSLFGVAPVLYTEHPHVDCFWLDLRLFSARMCVNHYRGKLI
jgi:hypothetical protein